MDAKILEFYSFNDIRGSLVSLQELDNVPFIIRRVFYIWNVPFLEKRGGHAHQNCQQVLVAVSGRVIVHADAKAFYLDKPNQGLYIPAGVMVEMSCFSPDCVLLVLASDKYDKDDYILQNTLSQPATVAWAAV